MSIADPRPKPRVHSPLVAITHLILTILLTIALNGCQDAPPGGAPAKEKASANPVSPAAPFDPDGRIIAEFRDLRLSREDLEEHTIQLAENLRPKPGENLEEWYRGQIREIAVSHVLYQEALASNLASSAEFAKKRRNAERQLVLSTCEQIQLSQMPPIDLKQLEEEYEKRKEELSSPEQRLTYHIFRRVPTGTDKTPYLAEMENIRYRVLQGERFQLLAKTLSDSETRHRDGLVSWLLRGSIPESLEKIIFSLDEGVPSEPVATADGVHLFYVETLLPAKHPSFEEAKPELISSLRQQRRDAVINALAEQYTDTIIAPDRDAFSSILQSGEDEAVLVADGEWTLTLGDLKNELRQHLTKQAQGNPISPIVSIESSWQYFTKVLTREQAYRSCQTTQSIQGDTSRTRLEQWEKNELTAIQRSRRLTGLAEKGSEALQTYYDNNVGRFSTQPSWTLKLLSIPIGENASEIMGRLEQASASADETVENLADELGGNLETLEHFTQERLRLLNSNLPPLIAPLNVGDISAPYRNQNRIEVMQVMERTDSTELPFDKVREQVVAAYLRQYTPELYAQLEDEILSSSPLTIHAGPLQTLIEKQTKPADISVDELEEMLEKL